MWADYWFGKKFMRPFAITTQSLFGSDPIVCDS